MDDALVDLRVPVEPVYYEAPPDEPAQNEVIPSTAELLAAPVDEEQPKDAQGAPQLSGRRWHTWQLAVASVVALMIGLAAGRMTHSARQTSASPKSVSATGSPTKTDGTTAQPAAGSQTPRAPAVTVAGPPTSTQETVPGGHAVLLNIPRHTGALVTDHFTVSSNKWILGWAYDCTSQGGTGAFNITVFDGSGGPSKDGAVDQQGAKGSSVVAYTSTGDRYLSVTTNCVWAIRVTT